MVKPLKLNGVSWRRFIVITIVLLCHSHKSSAQRMIFPGNEWVTATPESVLVDSERLQAAVDGLDKRDKTLIVKNGRVIWAGEDVHQRTSVFSAATSFTSTVLGLLIDDGLMTLDTHVSEFVPELLDEYSATTFRHFATHTSGYRGSALRPSSPWFEPPGSQFKYGDSYAMLANAVTQAADESLEDIFTRRIAEPIQMNLDEFSWLGSTTDDVKVNNGASGLAISADNAARFGHLFLNRGYWGDTQLISSEWVDAATQNQVPTMPVHPSSGTLMGPGVHGFGWWTTASNWYEASGYNNNHISVNPATGMVIASLDGKSGPAGDAEYTRFRGLVGAATMPATWDTQGDGQWDQVDPSTGKLRWVAETGVVPDIYPTYEAIIRSNTVTIGDSLHIRSDRLVSIERAGALVVDGILNANRIDISENGGLVVDGQLSVDTLDVADGTIVVHDSRSPVNIERRVMLEDDSKLEFVITDESWESPLYFLNPRLRPGFAGDLVLDFSTAPDWNSLVGSTLDLIDWEGSQPTSEFARVLFPDAFDLDLSRLYTSGEVDVISVTDPTPLQGGDADQDLDFDQLDLVQVQVAAKYLTGEPATWGEGDWNGAPGGYAGSPPEGDGVFDQLDIVAAQQAGVYLSGPYATGTAEAVALDQVAIPVPEPSNLLLLGIGMLALLWRGTPPRSSRDRLTG